MQSNHWLRLPWFQRVLLNNDSSAIPGLPTLQSLIVIRILLSSPVKVLADRSLEPFRTRLLLLILLEVLEEPMLDALLGIGSVIRIDRHHHVHQLQDFLRCIRQQSVEWSRNNFWEIIAHAMSHFMTFRPVQLARRSKHRKHFQQLISLVLSWEEWSPE